MLNNKVISGVDVTIKFTVPLSPIEGIVLDSEEYAAMKSLEKDIKKLIENGMAENAENVRVKAKPIHAEVKE
ncbi:hypothetical protein 035JT001_74 [Bacillus phage 035JT001]|nr:hypothetical protein 035JT001_74 [Bacillus phage 035JT001]